MSFPTARDAEALGHWLLARGVADEVVRRRPSLADRVELLEDQPAPVLRIALSESDDRCVVLARVADRSFVSWAIVTPDTELTRLADTETDTIATQVIEAYDRFA